MQSRAYPINAVSGADVFPTTDGTYYTDAMTDGYTGCNVYLEFFSDAAGTVPATATAGTATVKGSPMGNIYLLPTNLSTINAAEVSAGTYTPAKLNGLMQKGSVTLSGIVGAAYAKAVFWRY